MAEKINRKKMSHRLKSLDAYYQITPFLMKTRQDASNYFMDSLEVTEIDKFIRKLRNDGYKGIGLLHLFIAAYIRTVSQRPALNRYICGQRIYSRSYIEYVMTVKKELKSDAGETSIKVMFEPTDTLIDVYNKMNEQISLVREKTAETSTDDVAGLFMKLPRFLLRWAIRFVDFLDYHNIMPQFLHEASPFHASVIISDIGSLGIPPIYHHLYDFGNIPIFVTLGAKRKAYELDRNGNVAERKYVDYTIVQDERICDGFYYAQSFKFLKAYMKNPEQLLVPPETVVEDVR